MFIVLPVLRDPSIYEFGSNFVMQELATRMRCLKFFWFYQAGIFMYNNQLLPPPHGAGTLIN